MSHTSLLLLPLAALGSAAPLLADLDPTPEPARAGTPAVQAVRELLQSPLVDASAEAGAVWARGRDQRVRFSEGAFEILPVFGPSSPREWPVRVTVGGASVGAAALDVTPVSAPVAEGAVVVQERVDLRGVHHLGLDGVEQTFVFDALPSRGELVVDLRVETDLVAEVDGDGLRFAHPSFGGVDVGAAFALDSDGRRTAIDRVWTGDGIQLVVPAAFVASASLPLTIDPVWSTFASSFGVADDGRPDVVFAGESNRYVVVWEEYTSAQNRDVYATYWDGQVQSQGAAIAIDMTSEDWTAPALAYVNAVDRVLVAASVGLGTNQSRVEGRFVDVGPFATAGAAFAISSTGGSQKSSVDVGGSNLLAPSSSRFAVSWTRLLGLNDSNVEYRVLAPDGTFSTAIVAVDATGANDVMSTMSQGLGDTYLVGDNWHIAWVRDDDGDGRGDVWAKRLYFNGNAAQSSAPFQVTFNGLSSHPSVSSLLDQQLHGDSTRFAVIAYERHYSDVSRPSGYQTDIRVAALREDGPAWPAHLGWMEDGRTELLQARPKVVTNGRAVYVTYLEEPEGQINSGLWDVYMATGEFAPMSGVGRELALIERHVALGTHSDSEHPVAVTTRWNGETNSNAIDGVAVWTRDLGSAPAGYGRIEGAHFSYPLPMVSTLGPVGAQYGDANPNSTGGAGWLRILGDRNRATLHLAQARDLPANSFGFLIASTDYSSVNHPGGSAGRLLVGGQIGRYVTQIASSGAGGNIDVVIDPLSIPQPNGAVSAVLNDTWLFQLWHRDSVNGGSTSNFTNGCSIQFVQ